MNDRYPSRHPVASRPCHASPTDRGARTLLLALTLLAAPAAAQEGPIRDVVIKTDGSRIRNVEVEEASAETVTVADGGEQKEIPAREVAAIEWDDPPEEYARARVEQRRGAFETAANLYLEARENTSRAPLRHELRFLAGRAMLRAAGDDASKAAAAEKTLREYLDEAPRGFHLPEAKLLVARALNVQGSHDRALEVLQEIEQAAITEGWPRKWDAWAKLERGKVLAARGKGAEARSAFRSAAAAAETMTGDADAQALRTQALLAEGETYLQEERYDEALRFFGRHTGPGNDPVLRAAALAGEGQARYGEGAKAGDETALRQAQLALAHAQVLDTSSGDPTARALYFSGKVLLALNELGPGVEKDARARARSYFDTLVRHYPSSRWAQAAREELGP